MIFFSKSGPFLTKRLIVHVSTGAKNVPMISGHTDFKEIL